MTLSDRSPRIALLFAAAALALGLAACQPAGDAPETGDAGGALGGPPDAEIVIGQAGTICRGSCPEYKLIMSSDGRALFLGGRFAPREGLFQAEVEPGMLDMLVQAAEGLGYFELDADYDDEVSDVPTTYSYLQAGDRRHGVRDRFGAPRELQLYEDLVLEAANELDWTEVEAEPEGAIWAEEGFGSWLGERAPDEG